MLLQLRHNTKYENCMIQGMGLRNIVLVRAQSWQACNMLLPVYWFVRSFANWENTTTAAQGTFDCFDIHLYWWGGYFQSRVLCVTAWLELETKPFQTAQGRKSSLFATNIEHEVSGKAEKEGNPAPNPKRSCRIQTAHEYLQRTVFLLQSANASPVTLAATNREHEVRAMLFLEGSSLSGTASPVPAPDTATTPLCWGLEIQQCAFAFCNTCNE